MKVGTIALSLLLLCGALAFSGAQEDSGSAGEMQEIDWVIDANSFNYENPELDLWETVTATANLTVNPIPLSNDVAADKINVMIASRDLPDIISHYRAFAQMNLSLPAVRSSTSARIWTRFPI